MINMDGRGQLSAEYILMVGFVLLVILLIAFFATDQTEQNSIAAAARIGAANTSAEIGILNTTTRPIRVTRVDMTSGTNITITIFLSNTDLSSDQKQTILAGVQQAIENEGFTVQNNAGNNLTIDTLKHDYLIKLS
ncbi:class III signal peptide-containing protein [Methanobacterium petrolearium]|uniref:class III signal peptide-containing protein n=1 Tax=Methanobacterium petrolearium TaxID=710190 RepID=UPI001AE3A37E|nr:class III signal peptide-containing protein [Methanobacterium petrolearium]MBP1945244.1 uncharacterized protein (UPF0333 family) [Methanobacterium petrolearium]